MRKKKTVMNISKKATSSLRCTAAVAILALASSCAKETTTYENDDVKLYLDAWMSVNHPGVQPTGLGVYIIDDQPGSGEAVTDDDYYYFIRYTATDLDGNISGTSEEKVAQQTGSYTKGNYYGPTVVMDSYYATQPGVLEAIKGMKVGGTRTVVVPGWLNSTISSSTGEKYYTTAEEFYKNKSGSNTIYTLTLTDKTDNINKWEVDSLERYTARMMNDVDSTFYGYYYQQLKEPTDTTTFPRDTTFYINYIGRLLNGQVFDTTIEDTAKFYGIYSSSKTYKPQMVKLNETYTEITLGGSSSSDGSTTIDGFAYCLSKLKSYEKGICAFYSALGYNYSGSGNVIPKFAPLTFEIEIVDKEE